MALLGFEVALDPAKCLPPAEVFAALGVVVDLSRAPAGEIEVRNKESQVSDLVQQLEEVIRDGRLADLMHQRFWA
eukprot:6436773-Amphidinium_carterae.1